MVNVPVPADAIIEYLRNEAGRPLKAKELARALDVAQEEYGRFKALLQRMEDDGSLYRVQRQRYAAPERINLTVGRLQSRRNGSGFVIPDSGGDDIFIPVEAIGSARDGDRVIARIERRRRGQRTEGTIIRVLERARQSVVGTFHRATRGRGDPIGYVVPEDPRMGPDVIVGPDSSGEATEGDIVVVRMLEWGEGRRAPLGEVERVLGRPDSPGVDILAIIHGHELPLEFPDAVTREAERLGSRGVSAADLAGREDLRDRLIFTIDPADAKDHDDALSIREVDEGWEVGVHIADVSHYVREGAPLDTEAALRGTSTYLVDRVVPMLPHALSAGLCSLRPEEDRLAMSLDVVLDADGQVLRHRLYRSVIRSRHRLSYEQAQGVLEGAATIDPATDGALRQLSGLARRLREQRFSRGSLDFDLPESRVVLNAAGEPTDIQRLQRLESHRLIEDFMLLANETIAARAEAPQLPFIYRVHERPDERRLQQLAEFAATFGHRLPSRAGPRDLQALLERVRGRPEEALLSTAVLRSMKQARYSPDNAGHFGLAAHHYTHFTSPIRRYPDLVIHRLCARYFIECERPGPGLAEALASVARLSSERERVAVAAERDSIELKKVEFMERHLGDEFDGTVSNVRAFGFHVLLDAFHVEGLVHVSSLADDYYIYVEDRFELVGESRGQRFRVGDRVRIQVAAVDREARHIDFVLLRANSDGGAAGRTGRSRKRSDRKPPDGRGPKPPKGKRGGRGRRGSRN
jgi:ribonuclease R